MDSGFLRESLYTGDQSEVSPPAHEHRHHKRRLERHTPHLYRICDQFSGVVIYSMIIFSPWAFGCTQPWAIWVMNIAGYTLGVMLGVKWLIRRLEPYARIDSRTTQSPRFIGAALHPLAKAIIGSHHQTPSRWGDGDNPRWTTRVLAVLTVVLLGWCLVSALNARSTINFDTLDFNYRESWIPWLPHSYHAPASWFEFWKYLGLACSFWAIRDWILGQTRRERLHQHRQHDENNNKDPFANLPPEPGAYVPARLRTLLWLVCLNGTLLAVEGVAQRLEGTNKLLWLVEPRINKTPESQFGPYAYRSNACQYLNLVWPLCLGFWWILRHASRRSLPSAHRIGASPHVVLLPCIAVIISASLLSMSRGGVLITTLTAALAIFVLYAAARRSRSPFSWAVPAAAAGVLVILCIIAWPVIKPRLYGHRKAYAISPGLSLGQFTLRSAFLVPKDTTKIGWGFVAGLTRSETGLYGFPPDAALVIRSWGGLSMMFYGPNGAWQELPLLTNLIAEYQGQLVDLVVARDELPRLYINGAPKPLPDPSRIPQMATNPVAAAYLRVEPDISVFDAPPALLSAWNVALSESEIAELHEQFKSGALKVGTNPRFAPPLIEIDHEEIRSRTFLLEQMTGRRETYATAKKMLQDFVWLGSGPGTFGPLYGLYRPSTRDYWTWWAHNDWLEFRITFGRIGIALAILALVTAAISPLQRGGLPLPIAFPALLWVAMIGCLAHARYDFPFQIHSVAFMFLLLLSLCSIVSRR